MILLKKACYSYLSHYIDAMMSGITLQDMQCALCCAAENGSLDLVMSV